ncbi:MAG: cupin domain-containing protein [Candidatus Nanohalobium sp.]
MKFTEGDSYFVDDNTQITDLLEAPEDGNFDSVIGEVDGYHPAGDERKKIFNENSQKGYYILEGDGKIYVGNEVHEVEKGDFVLVPEKTNHALEGDFKALIVTSPPFDPEDEELR